MNALALATATAVLLLLVLATLSLWHVRRLRRRHAALHQLLDHADHLEADLKECRHRLDRAHAVMEVKPGQPVAGETGAREAVDAGLRSLLEHRLWIRDQSARASQAELDAAVTALTRARAQLEPQLRALDQAQRGLEQAVRDHIAQERT